VQQTCSISLVIIIIVIIIATFPFLTARERGEW
jgi:hypothetical protein